MAISAEAQNQIVALTVGMFDASPGAQYLTELADVYEQQGGIDAVANYLATSAVFNDQYAGLVTTEGRINKALDLLGLEDGTQARDEAATFFQQRSDEGASETAILVEAINFLNQEEVPDTFADAKAKFDNKVEVATYQSVELQAGSDNIDELKNVLANVTADPASVEAAKGDQQGATGETFTLTTDVETREGTASNDTFRGVVDDNNGTYQSGDEITGGAGTDELKLTVTNDANDPVGTMDAVENVYVRSLHGGSDVDASAWTGIEQLWSEDSQQDLTLSNVGELATVGVDNVEAAYTVGFDAALLTGSDDNIDVVANGTTGTVGLNISAGADDIESLSFTASDASSFNVDVGDSLETVNVAGDSTLTLADQGDSFDAVDTIAAGDATGDVSITVGGSNTEDVSATFGAGDDMITILNDLDDNDTIDMGEGEDRIALGEAVTVEDLDLASVEEYEARAVGGSVDLANISGLIVSNAANGDTLQNIELDNAVTLDGTMTGTLDLQYAGAGDPGADSDEVSITLGEADSYDVDGSALTINNVETINFESATATVEANQAANTIHSNDFAGNSVSTVNFTGDEDVVFSVTGANTGDLRTVDASGMTGDATADIDLTDMATNYSGTLTITGTANDDTITVDSGNADEDSDIIAGAGADTIELTDGTADGATRVVYNSFDDGGDVLAEDLVAGDVITDFDGDNGSGGDEIVISGDLASGLVGDSVASTSQGNVDLNAGDGVFFFDGDTIDLSTAGTESSFNTVQTAIGDLSNEASGDGAVFVLEDAGEYSAAVYAFQSANADDEVTEDEVQLLGVVNDASTNEIASTDFNVV